MRSGGSEAHVPSVVAKCISIDPSLLLDVSDVVYRWGCFTFYAMH